MASIKLIFRGSEYSIPDTKAFEVGERVEDIASLPEILSWLKKPRYYKMARCIGEMLRFAGAEVTDREVHTDLMDKFRAGETGDHLAALFMLVSVLMDGVVEGDAPADAESEAGKPDAS